MKLLIFTIALAMGIPSFAEKGAAKAGAFELGKRAYDTGNYPRALDLFSQAINQASDPASRNKAYYFQGLVLFELGHFYSSYISFRNVLLSADDKNREVYEKAIKNAVLITDRLYMADRVGKILQKLPSNFIPPSVTGLSNYAMGVYHFEQNQVDDAVSRFKSVPPENPYYSKAVFYLGVLSVRKKDYKEASFYFGKVIELSRGRKDLFARADLARLNLARTLYSAGEIEKSIEVYSQFVSSSPHWLTVLLEASWPLMRVNDTTVSLGNLHTITSPFYHEEMVGEAYILRTTILFSLCKYEEMRRTLAQFFTVYDPILRSMEQETSRLGNAEGFFRAFATEKGMNRAFLNFAKRDEGIRSQMKVLEFLQTERQNIGRLGRSEQMQRMAAILDETEKSVQTEIGATLQKMHKRKLTDLIEQREQANYLKVEIVTGEKELIEHQKGLPPKRIVDVETAVSSNYHFWPFNGEFWEDELGTYVYTTESSCVN